MGQYLNKITSTMGDRRTAQIFKEVSKKQRTGEVKNFQEFSAELEALTKTLFITTIKSSLVIYNALENEIITSETYNKMLDQVYNDFEVLFESLSNIEKVAKAHEALLRDVVFNNIKNAIFDLENKTNLYETIAGSEEGFNKILSSTFKEASLNVFSRNDLNLEFLYKDPRKNEIILSDENSTIDNIGERLTLGINKENNYTISSAQVLYDSFSVPSDIDVAPSALSISNIYDGNTGTYWMHPLLFKEEKKKAYMSIKLRLEKGEEINYLILEPISDLPLVLESFKYKDKDSSVVELSLGQISVAEKARISFPKINTDVIYLTFSSINPNRIEFEYKITNQSQLNESQLDIIIDDYIGLTQQTNQSIRSPTVSSANREALLKVVNFPPLISGILGVSNAQQIEYNVNNNYATTSLNDGISNSTNIVDPTTLANNTFSESSYTSDSLRWTGQEFLFGLDSIYLGYFEYDSRSVYVSPPIVSGKNSILGLTSKETRFSVDVNNPYALTKTESTYDLPRVNLDLSPSTLLFLNSIEYWVVKNTLSADLNILKSETFPILPLGTTRINHEVLVLTKKSSFTDSVNTVGFFMFFTSRAKGEIDIYRNGILLNDETGNPLASEGWRAINEDINSVVGAGTRMKFEVEIINAISTDIFTSSYIPLTSETRALPALIDINGSYIDHEVPTVDLIGNSLIRALDNNVITVEGDKINTKEEIVHFYLKIIQRQSSARNNISSAVEEYKLLINSIDPNKFNALQ